MNPRDEFHLATYFTAMNALETHMKRRSEVCKEVPSRFAFLNEVDFSGEQYSPGSQKIVNSYPVARNMNLCGKPEQLHYYMCAKI